MYKTIAELQNGTKDIDQLIYTAVFAPEERLRQQARIHIRKIADENGIFSASIKPLYAAAGRGEVFGFTVPAFNIRALTYDTARTLFRLAHKKSVGAMIFEIARSEIGYTEQRPDEYAICVLAAAIKEGYRGPVFIQGDHFQFSKNKFLEDPAQETKKIETLIAESIEATFYNIDIDASTLVDLSKKDLMEQQKDNYTMTAKLTHFIRNIQSRKAGSGFARPKHVAVAIGGEIGHIGGKNSTVSDFMAFMNGYLSQINKTDGISKVSVQTGTSHGGLPLADGTIADVKLDFSVLKDIGNVARRRYGLGGAVQHGASTLPNDLFDKFVTAGTLEIHLATGFQNIVYDNLPSDLKETMYRWISDTLQSEREKGWSDDQFMYKTRKKALGPFKKELWFLGKEEKTPILEKLEAQFNLLFEKLNVVNTKNVVGKYIQPSVKVKAKNAKPQRKT